MSSPSAPNPTAPDLRHAVILGRGRSGTTWISQILNRSRGCLYKDEPFNPGKNERYSAWQHDLGERDAAEMRERFDRLARGCVHDVDYPPFLPKHCRWQPAWSLRATWQLGKVVPALRGIYHVYGRPRYGREDWVLTKQVNFPNEKLPALVDALQPRLIAVLRGPYSSVSSSLRFYQKTAAAELRPPHAIARVAELTQGLADFGIEPLSEAQVNALSDAAFEALRWRIQTEPLARFTDEFADGLCVTHEAFAADPQRLAREVFDFLGWEFEAAVEEFIRETTTSGDRHQAFASEEKKQHGVVRDPKDAVERWRRDLSEEQIAEVRSMVESSPLLSLWDQNPQDS